MRFADDFFARMSEPMAEAYSAMEALEKGAIANPDEQRQVGHYWLRNPVIAPAGYGDNIKEVWQQLKEFSARPDVAEFQNILWIGIGTYYQYQ